MTTAPASSSAIESQITALEDERYQAMLERNFEVLERLFHAQMYYLHSSGGSDTKESYLKSLRAKAWEYHTIRREQQHIVASDHTALVFHQLFMDISVGGQSKQMSNRALAVWTREGMREGEGWQLIGVQSSTMPPGTY